MRLKSVVVACLALVLSAGILPAGPIYQQVFDGSGNAFSSQNDDTGGYGNFATLYDNFTLTDAAGVTGVYWVGAYYNGAPAAITSWTVTFWADNAGQPGSALYTETIAGTGGELYLGDYGGLPLYTYDVQLTAPFSAGAGTTYWLSVVPTLGFPPQWGWATGTGGDGALYQDFMGGRFPMSGDSAFALYDASSATPEPVSLTLAGLGLVALAFAARRRSS